MRTASHVPTLPRSYNFGILARLLSPMEKMDKDAWRFINTFAPWLSAVGTISAVIVSLYLATKNRRIYLKVSASLQTIVQTGMPSRDYATISVINFGGREATITAIGWRVGVFRKTLLFQMPGAPVYSTTLPARLRDGETANFFMPIAAEPGSADWLPMIREHLGKHPRWSVFTLKAEVFTSVGKVFRVRIDSNLRRLLIGDDKKKKK
jgi:hypothetical protein